MLREFRDICGGLPLVLPTSRMGYWNPLAMLLPMLLSASAEYSVEEMAMFKECSFNSSGTKPCRASLALGGQSQIAHFFSEIFSALRELRRYGCEYGHSEHSYFAPRPLLLDLWIPGEAEESSTCSEYKSEVGAVRFQRVSILVSHDYLVTVFRARRAE